MELAVLLGRPTDRFHCQKVTYGRLPFTLCHAAFITHGNRCIHVTEFWCLKPGFRHILSSNAHKCVFTNHVSSAASESEFDHANRIVSESGCASLYNVKVFKMSKLAMDCLLTLWSFQWVASLLRNRPWNQLHNFSVPRHEICWERTTLMH